MESTVQHDSSLPSGGFLNNDNVNTLVVTSEGVPEGSAKVVAYNRKKGVKVELLLTELEVTGLYSSIKRCIQHGTNSVTSIKNAVAVMDSYGG